MLPLNVTASDIVSISGKKAEFVERPSVQSKYIVSRPQTAFDAQDEVTFLSTWQDKEKANLIKVRWRDLSFERQLSFTIGLVVLILF